MPHLPLGTLKESYPHAAASSACVPAGVARGRAYRRGVGRGSLSTWRSSPLLAAAAPESTVFKLVLRKKKRPARAGSADAAGRLQIAWREHHSRSPAPHGQRCVHQTNLPAARPRRGWPPGSRGLAAHSMVAPMGLETGCRGARGDARRTRGMYARDAAPPSHAQERRYFASEEPMSEAVEEAPERRAFYARINAENLTALWTVMGSLITPEPRSACMPALWRFASLRPLMLEAGALITAKEAERRVLVLENPGLRGQSRITTSLYAGIQMVLPGEVAPAHRHSQSALRFVLEGSGAYTTVDGERTMMEPGDLVITPSMTWHDHGNRLDAPVFWLDGLDIPIVQFFDASFAQSYGADEQPVRRQPGHSLAKYGYNLLPLAARAAGGTSPIFSYPYARTREALIRMQAADEWDPCHGLKVRYAHPATGGHAMPGIGTFIQLLPKGFSTARYRATDAQVFAVVEGRGKSRVLDTLLEWSPGDVFVVPSWRWVTHEAETEAVLFSFSDRPVQEKLDLFREDRGNAPELGATAGTGPGRDGR
jgi:gentisate 1,2-dioxygenase